MMIDFETPMSIYELLALSISIIAIIIPIGRCLWNKWFRQAILKYYPLGTAFLYCNRSGSYIRIDGVFEALRKPISIKKINISINRKKDSKKLNLTWSSFISPINQIFAGNYTSVTETAHPFRIEENSMFCCFIEFADICDYSYEIINSLFNNLIENLDKNISTQNLSYEDAYSNYVNCAQYKELKEAMGKEFFWEIGKYDIIIYVQFSKKTVEFHYSVFIDESTHKKLRKNVDESLVAPLKKKYKIDCKFQNTNVEITPIDQKIWNRKELRGQYEKF